MTENLNGIEVMKTYQELPSWKGPDILNTYGNKAVLDFEGCPVFAELFALRSFMKKGFSGVWADTFRRTFRTELPEKKEPKISLPNFVLNQLNQINPDGKLSGTWDLILWKNGQIKFVELKRKSKDKIRQTQLDFFERALKSGLSISSFEIYEWTEKKE